MRPIKSQIARAECPDFAAVDGLQFGIPGGGVRRRRLALRIRFPMTGADDGLASTGDSLVSTGIVSISTRDCCASISLAHFVHSFSARLYPISGTPRVAGSGQIQQRNVE
jgi:hypothetical protein